MQMSDLLAGNTPQASMRARVLVAGLLSVCLLVVIMWLPPATGLTGSAPHMLAVHLLMELFAIIIAILIVTVSWHTFDARQARSANILVCGFLVVACCDLVHALAYKGMPPFLAESSTERAIFFWLMGRTAEVATMALVALEYVPPLPRRFWLGMGVALSGALVWFGSWHLDAFPATFVEGQGVSAFKAAYEYVLCLLNLGVAVLFWRRAERTGMMRYYLLALSNYVMGIGEITFTGYVSPSDFQNVFGHAYKITAYFLLYWATFLTSIRAPIEALRQSQGRLLKSEAQLKMAEQIAQLGSWTLDLRTGKAIWSDEVFTMFELDRARFEPTYETFLSVIHPDDRKALNEAYLHSLETRAPFEITHRLLMRDGRVKWLQEKCRTDFDAAGKALVSHGFVQDITERVRIEAHIRESENKFHMLFDSAKDCLLLLSLDGMILDINPYGHEHLGYAKHEMVGRPIAEFDAPEFADRVPTRIAEVQRYGHATFESAHLRRDGSVMPVEINCMLVEMQGKPRLYSIIRDITERKQAEEEIRRLAFYDQLTSLPNRRLLQDRLRQAMVAGRRNNRHGAVLFIDLDDFKTLNDTLGHDTGDLMLKQAAQRLESCMREGDTVSRMGGDEFVVILEGLDAHAAEAAAQAAPVGQKILDALHHPYQLAAHDYRISTCIGATLFNGHEQSMDELLKQADIAMYQAKKTGRNTLRFFDPQMQASINQRGALEAELHKAVEQRQFQLHYQIQVDSARRPLGAEALIRWNHPGQGIISPMQFIPLAEETGLILPIGRWVLDTACARLKAWEANPATRELALAVNVSARQFHQPDFVAQVQGAVERHAINPRLLKLELTESLLLENIDDTVATMGGLSKIGVHLSLDDFGTGYSSLQYLKLLPLNQIKIDQSFVRDIATDPNDAAIVQTIIAMARTLGLDLIAEGVETEMQRELLELNGCHAFQGYLFGRPAPVEEFEALLK